MAPDARQPDLFSVPRARWSDPSTSRQAAESISLDKVSETQRMVMSALDVAPASDEELIERCRLYWPTRKVSDQSIRSRRAELVRRGLVRDSGTRSRTVHDRESIVWCVS